MLESCSEIARVAYDTPQLTELRLKCRRSRVEAFADARKGRVQCMREG